MTTEVEIGLFYINICINDDCQLIAYEKLKPIQSPQAMRNISIMQLVNKVQGQYIILSYIVSFLLITMCSEFKIINSFVFFYFTLKSSLFLFIMRLCSLRYFNMYVHAYFSGNYRLILLLQRNWWNSRWKVLLPWFCAQ